MSTSVPNLRFYSTLTHRKEDFVPIDPGNVRFYACGPTVYDHLHIGNGRMLIVFDVLFRLLRHVYGGDHVTYVRNITDVDDKINARAAERGIDIRQLTDEMTAIFHEDAKALGCLAPTVEPRATEHMEEMKAIIERLVARQCAYVAEDHVLFAVGSMPDYGALARRSLDEMIAGARVEVAPYKRSPMDFVLWKPSKRGEPSWPSPAGIATPGRPGWHIECSAMAWKHLGEVFDIHGGGIDLVFPHHENELAQTRCAFGHQVMANVWMHNGHLQVEGEKMSKSLGNFVTIRELWATENFGGQSWLGEVLRFAIIKSHYRQPTDFTVRNLSESRTELQSWANALAVQKTAMLDAIGQHGVGMTPRPAPQVIDALSDDLNTPQVITELRAMFDRFYNGDTFAAFELIQSCVFLGVLRPHRLGIWNPHHVGSGGKLALPQHQKKLDEIQVAYGNGNAEREATIKAELMRQGVKATILEDGSIGYEYSNGIDIDSLIALRKEARLAKNWAESDRIRDELAGMGIALKDDKDGTTTWEVKR
ncbi:MAG: cysteine--tRNA ligase [Methylobacteriaceae bacterium]|nr:cysteine--tRNA ligase [Methylobacteriaceae bacterium]